MNAPKTMKPVTKPISLAHKVLLKSDDALCIEEVACAILGVDKPSKIDLASVRKQLKKLSDLGMIEMVPRAGGVPFYRLIAAPAAESAESGRADIPTKTYPPSVLKAMVAELTGDSEGGEADAPVTFLCPDDYEMPPADPAQLASANRMLCERMEGIAEALRASTIPELEGVTGAEDLAPHVKTLCDALAATEITSVARGKTIDQLRLEIGDLRDQVEKNIQDHAKESAAACAALDDIVFEPFSTSLSGHIKEAVNEFKKVTAERADLRERLDGVTQQSIADTVALTEKNARIIADLKDMTRERDLMKAENLALKTLEGSMPGFGAEHQEQRINSLTTDVINTRNALTNTINEADRLRSELATARVLIKAMQEHGNVKDVAVGYLVRVPKRAPVLRRKPESARAAALSAVRAGAARAEVMAVVPVGTARRGAEWKGA